MKWIQAIIRSHKLDEVREALSEVGVSGVTAHTVRGFGRQKGHIEIYRGSEYQVDFVQKTQIDVMVADDIADQAIAAISKSAKTGKIGDGKIFISSFTDACRIRTGETGPEAL